MLGRAFDWLIAINGSELNPSNRNEITQRESCVTCHVVILSPTPALPQSTERTKNINLTASFSPLIQNHSCKSHNEQWIATWALQYRYIFENTHDLLTVVTPFNRNFKENNTIGYYFQFDHVVDQRKVKAIYRGPYVRESVCLAYNSKFYIGQRERGEKPRHIYAG